MKYKTVFINGKQIREHRYVMEKHLGRKLDSSEIVHHINGDGLNNDICNLEIMSRSEHMKHHYRDSSVVGRLYENKYNYNKELITKLYIDEYRSVPAISKIINIPKESIYHYLVKNNIKREKKTIYCECGNIATYLKKTVCKKCYLKDYYAKRKN